MKKGIVVLSLFDGMSCGMIALDRAGIKVKKYYASEIDKYAQIVSAANYPEIIRLGDITKWKEWNIEKPDLIIGGSPCQGFSFAGKGLNFNDPRSKLFFTFVDILKHYKPKYFLLENVRMKKEYQKVISDCLGVEPIEINSALVSAQNRKRLYWTNIPGVTQPKDKGVFLKDIIESAGKGAIKNNGTVTNKTEKSQCLDANYFKGVDNHGQRTIIRGGAFRGRNKENPSDRTAGISTVQRLEINKTGKSNTLTGVQKDNCLVIGKADLNGHDICKRVYSTDHKSPTVPTGQSGNTIPKIVVKPWKYKNDTPVAVDAEKMQTLRAQAGGKTKGVAITDGLSWRKLTPVECERLQTVPDNYTNHVSNSQRYKMLGNGWTVDVIAHIFRGLK